MTGAAVKLSRARRAADRARVRTARLTADLETEGLALDPEVPEGWNGRSFDPCSCDDGLAFAPTPDWCESASLARAIRGGLD